MTSEAAVDLQSPVVQAVGRLSDRALARLVGANAYLRGRVYARQSCVHDISVIADEATCRILGRASDPYDVRIRLSSEGGLTSKCSCPAWRGEDRHCKHVAALLVSLRDRVRPSRGGQDAGEKPGDEEPSTGGITAPPGREGGPREREGREAFGRDAGPREGSREGVREGPREGAREGVREGARDRDGHGRGAEAVRGDGRRERDRHGRDRANGERHDRRDPKGRRRDEGAGGPREVVVMDRGGPRVVSAGGSATVQSVTTSSAGPSDLSRGLGAWLPSNEPRKAPEIEYRIHVRASSLAVTPYLSETRAAVGPAEAIEQLGALPSVHRPILRLLARLHPKGARGAQVETRGEDAAELIGRLRGKRVLVEPMLMELRYLDEPLVPRLELEMVPPTHVRLRAVFERKTGDARKFLLHQGLWLEGDPGWHLDPIQGVARPLAEHVTSTWMERLLKNHAITHPIADLSKFLVELLPKVSVALNAPLPDIHVVADVLDLPPRFTLRAAGDLTRVVATLDVRYGEHEFLVPPVDLPPPLTNLDLESARPKFLRRDIGAERLGVHALLEGGLEVTDDFRAFQAEGEKALRFWSECVPNLPSEWNTLVPEHFKGMKVRGTPVTPKARVASGVDWLSLDVEFGSEGSRVSEEDLRRALEMGNHLVRLEDGTFARIDGLQVQEVLARMQEIYSNGKGNLPLSQAGRVQDLLDTLGQRAALPRSTRDFFAALGEHKVEPVEPPADLEATMRPYQQDGFSWLAYLCRTGTGGILADDMGLGKTLQAIALLLWVKRLSEPIDGGDARKSSAAKKASKTAKAAREASADEAGEDAKASGKKTAKRSAKRKDGDAEGSSTEPALTGPAPTPLEHGGPLALVIAPTSVVANWVREVQKFAPSLRAIAWTGADRAQYKSDIDRADVVVTSYALLRRDEEFLASIDWGYVILDEAQSIKNPTSATARAAKNIKGRRRLALTGTPIENRLSEIWSIFDFVSPGLLPPLAQFEERYARPIDRGDDEAGKRLRATVHPFVLRRTKGEVAGDLPEKIVTERLCEMSAEQASVYRTVLKAVRDTVFGEVEANGIARSQLQILAGLTRLRQAACDPRLLGVSGPFSDETSGKLVALRELIAEAQQGGHRTLVFSQFVSMLKLIEAALKADNIPYEYIDGDTKDRQQRVDRFNGDEQIPVFLISLKAGGTGLNLTGADTVVHFDPWWNPAVEDQATDRAHRIGQHRVVTAYRFVARGTIEEKILELSAKKRELVHQVLGQHDQDEKVAGVLTRAELDSRFADD